MPDLARKAVMGAAIRKLASGHALSVAIKKVRVFFCTLVGKRIVMLHSFIKKSDKTPPRERQIAEARMREVTHENT